MPFSIKTLKNVLLFSLWTALLACKPSPLAVRSEPVDILLIGGGIMSATLGSLLHELDPKLRIALFERLDEVALEASAAWNNAGTGHAAFSELNYTVQKEDGSIDIEKAVQINEAFEISRQFWAYAVERGKIKRPELFINAVPHMSFVMGDEAAKFLKKRYRALIQNPLFADMEYAEGHREIAKWAPLLMQGRDPGQRVAATRAKRGTDVDFGALTRFLIADLKKAPNNQIHLNHEVLDLTRREGGGWVVKIMDLQKNEAFLAHARFVFIGAGGGALPLLQKSGIEEAKAYAGFPVGGQWLVTHNKDLIDKHWAKVYGQAAVGAPPMSVPHLDTRYIGGEKFLLFGPFAVFSTKFLLKGFWTDILASFKWHNAIPMIQAGLKNFALTRYLVSQALLTDAERVESLRDYFGDAKPADWHTRRAGQRVQIIKKTEKGGVLQFGTEVVSSADRSLVALLGASPGASISARIALDVLENSFVAEMSSSAWQSKLKEIIPSYGHQLAHDQALYERIKKRTSQLLGLP